MKNRISEQDITDYALNELGPRERLYVESMLLGDDKMREEASSMIELARLLEEGFDAEVSDPQFTMGEDRRVSVLATRPDSDGRGMRRLAGGMLALAACVAFFVSTPEIWKSVVGSESPDFAATQASASAAADQNRVPGVPVFGQPSESPFSFQASVGEEPFGASVGMPTEPAWPVEPPFSGVELN